MRDWMKKLRQDANLTLKEAAAAAGISESYFSQIENGTRNASVAVAKRIGEVLKCPWERFFE